MTSSRNNDEHSSRPLVNALSEGGDIKWRIPLAKTTYLSEAIPGNQFCLADMSNCRPSGTPFAS